MRRVYFTPISSCFILTDKHTYFNVRNSILLELGSTISNVFGMTFNHAVLNRACIYVCDGLAKSLSFALYQIAEANIKRLELILSPLSEQKTENNKEAEGAQIVTVQYTDTTEEK